MSNQKQSQNVGLAITDEEIDGETLLNLTERMVERLFPTMKYQVLFRKRLDALIQHLTEELKTVENPVQVKEEPCSLSQISSTSTEPKPQGSPHPGPYVLPYFPPLLAMELENNNKGFLEPGKSRLRSQLINILADDIANYEW